MRGRRNYQRSDQRSSAFNLLGPGSHFLPPCGAVLRALSDSPNVTLNVTGDSYQSALRPTAFLEMCSLDCEHQSQLQTPETREQRGARDIDAAECTSLVAEFRAAKLVTDQIGSPRSPTGSTAGSVDPSEAAEEELQWRRGPHDHEEPILQPNDARFCLLPIK